MCFCFLDLPPVQFSSPSIIEVTSIEPLNAQIQTFFDYGQCNSTWLNDSSKEDKTCQQSNGK